MMYIDCDVFHFHGMYLNGIYGNKINKINIYIYTEALFWDTVCEGVCSRRYNPDWTHIIDDWLYRPYFLLSVFLWWQELGGGGT